MGAILALSALAKLAAFGEEACPQSPIYELPDVQVGTFVAEPLLQHQCVFGIIRARASHICSPTTTSSGSPSKPPLLKFEDLTPQFGHDRATQGPSFSAVNDSMVS